MGTTPSRRGRGLSHEARGLSGDHEDAIDTSSSSFSALSQYLADDDFRIHEETLDLRRPTASRVDARAATSTAFDAIFPKFKLRNRHCVTDLVPI